MEAEEPQQDKDEALQLQQQLSYYQTWARKLATAKPRPLSIAEILASQQLLVTGLPDGTTEFELENFINTQSAAHGAAVAPGAPVVSVTVTDSQALVLLRCSIEASNCLLFNGLRFNGAILKVKELLAPYGQLKSLSVAMDAATGKNKGYAFVVFASSTMVSEAIEELDCKVVEGKILAVQRATDGKATGINHRESLTGGGDTVGARDGSCASGPQPQPPVLQAQHRAAPWASSVTNLTSGATGPMHPPGPMHRGPEYDVNELYIGDLPLSWDEDAVRRLLGRYGKIKYFTLRSGRDKNFAFCKYKDSSVVDAAIQGLHGKIVDGYFLNVRRAIEGKQQHQLPPGRSSLDSRGQTSHLGAPQPQSQQHQLRPLQQHQMTLFGQPGPAGGWGAPGDVAASSNSSHDGDGRSNSSKPAQSQPQRQSLLQTWDMLSPWSLFSHHAH
eukprot:gene9960-10115_t